MYDYIIMGSCCLICCRETLTSESVLQGNCLSLGSFVHRLTSCSSAIPPPIISSRRWSERVCCDSPVSDVPDGHSSSSSQCLQRQSARHLHHPISISITSPSPSPYTPSTVHPSSSSSSSRSFLLPSLSHLSAAFCLSSDFWLGTLTD